MPPMGAPAAAGAGLLLLGGEGPRRALLAPYLPEVGAVVAADSGFDLALALNLQPDLVVGDFDSVTHRRELAALPAARRRRAAADKALTDAELGLQALAELGCRRVIVAGGGGGRFDHQLAVLGLFERDPRLQVWLTAAEHVEVIAGTARFRGQRHSTVSLFPLTAAVSGLASRGLRWPLDGLAFRRGWASVSNVVVADEWQVTVRRGRLLLVRNLAPLPIPPPASSQGPPAGAAGSAAPAGSAAATGSAAGAAAGSATGSASCSRASRPASLCSSRN